MDKINEFLQTTMNATSHLTSKILSEVGARAPSPSRLAARYNLTEHDVRDAVAAEQAALIAQEIISEIFAYPIHDLSKLETQSTLDFMNSIKAGESLKKLRQLPGELLVSQYIFDILKEHPSFRPTENPWSYNIYMTFMGTLGGKYVYVNKCADVHTNIYLLETGWLVNSGDPLPTYRRELDPCTFESGFRFYTGMKLSIEPKHVRAYGVKIPSSHRLST